MAQYTVIMDSVSVSAAQDLIRISSQVSGREYATGLFTGTGAFSNGQTVTIGTKVYTYQTTLTDVDGNVLIGANFAASLQNLYDAINLTGTPGTQYATSMTAHPLVRASAVTATTVTVAAKAVGEAGNLIVTSDTVANASWGASTLVGGEGALFAGAPRLSLPPATGFYVMGVSVRADISETSDKVTLGMYVGTSDKGVGTFQTPRPVGAAPPFAGTAAVNLTTAATKSPSTPVLSPDCDLSGEGANWYADDRSEALYVGPNSTFVLRLENAPASATVITATIVIDQ